MCKCRSSKWSCARAVHTIMLMNCWSWQKPKHDGFSFQAKYEFHGIMKIVFPFKRIVSIHTICFCKKNEKKNKKQQHLNLNCSSKWSEQICTMKLSDCVCPMDCDKCWKQQQKKMLETKTKNVISVYLFRDSMRQATVCDT